MIKNPSLVKAVKLLGGQTATARVVGAKDYRTVQQWIANGQVPARYCVKLELASGVSRYELRPSEAKEIWPLETADA